MWDKINPLFQWVTINPLEWDKMSDGINLVNALGGTKHGFGQNFCPNPVPSWLTNVALMNILTY